MEDGISDALSKSISTISFIPKDSILSLLEIE